jgi:hypothetical protein
MCKLFYVHVVHVQERAELLVIKTGTRPPLLYSPTGCTVVTVGVGMKISYFVGRWVSPKISQMN